MGLSIGIVGLPNVGKSTLFNALTESGSAEASNYPFCTIDPNVGIVPVPDERLGKLAEVVGTTKIIPAGVEFVDIAGLVAGAHKGEGLGNKFLAHIRECDAIAEVIRDFKDQNITHVTGQVDPESDKETIKIELVLADLETMSKRAGVLEKDAKRDLKVKAEAEFAQKIFKALESGTPAREVRLEDEDQRRWLKSYHLITSKPHIYIINSDQEQGTSDQEDEIMINAKIEAELAELSREEKEEYLVELGIKEPGLNRLIKKAYEMLGLQSFFTAGEKEVRAWTVKEGAKAPQAAGVIHTDFEKGFIKADVVNWKDLVEAEGWEAARKAGKVRLEGKDYTVQEGDVMIYKFNV